MIAMRFAMSSLPHWDDAKEREKGKDNKFHPQKTLDDVISKKALPSHKAANLSQSRIEWTHDK